MASRDGVSEQAGTVRAPWHLWVVGVISLLWNAGGALDYVMTRTGAGWYVANLTPEQIAYLEAFPLWMDLAWPLGVWGAVLGSVGLLLCRGWAVWMFALSLAGLFFATVYNFAIADAAAVMGGMGLVIFNIALWTVAILLLVYATAMRSRGVLS